MVQNFEKINLARLTELLSDGAWHSGSELTQKISSRLGAALHAARKKGYALEKRYIEGDGYEYRLMPSEQSERELQNKILLKRIHLSTQVAGGKPTIRDHDLTVEDMLGFLAAGETYETLSVQYGWLEPEDIQACFLYSQQLVTQVRAELSRDDLSVAIPDILEQAPFIKLLVLFGSRARGEASPGSDWDFAVLCDEEQYRQLKRDGIKWSLLHVWRVVQTAYDLRDDEIDMIDLNKCSDFLAHSVARDGYVLYEREPSLFKDFREDKLFSPEELEKINQRRKNKINQTIQVLKNESVRS